MAHKNKPDFFYEGAGRSEALDQLRRGIHLGGGVIALTGPTGSGRSSLIRKLMSSLGDEGAEVCFLSDDSAVLETEEELFSALAEGFGLEHKPIEMLEDLVDRVQHFIRLGLDNKRSLLIIVDDAKQHAHVVLEILLQLVEELKGLKLLLVSESAFVEELTESYSSSMLVQQVNLRPLSADEIANFLQPHFLQLGLPDTAILDRKTCDELMGKTGGNPSLLLREVPSLIADAGIQARRFRVNWPVMHIAAFLGVMIITALAFFYYSSGTDMPVAEDNNTSAGVVVPTTPDEGAVLPPVPTPEPTPPDLPAPVLTDNTKQADRYTAQEQVLLSRPAGNTSLQIMSLSSEKMMKDFIEHVGSTEPGLLNYYRRDTGDTTSYVLLYGDYPDKQAAMLALKTLPAVFKKSAPWPRLMADVQQELKQRQ